MLEALLRFHTCRANGGAKYNAIANCHVKGVTSIVLHDEPERRLRLFYASPHHEIFYSRALHDSSMTLAIHPHHCDVTLIPVLGDVINEIYDLERCEDGLYQECAYASAITGTEASLRPTGHLFRVLGYETARLRKGGTFLPAEETHSVWVPRGRPAAWLVLEGREDPAYTPVCYTMNPTFDTSEMYRPMTSLAVGALLRMILRELS